MERELRLADRKRLLLGPAFSPVQDFAIELLMYADGHRDEQKFRDNVRMAQLAGGADIRLLWPEWFPKQPIAEDKEEVDEEDYQNVEWVSPQDGEDFDELIRLQEELANNSISVFDTGGGEWQ